MGVLMEGKWYPEGYDTEVVEGAFQMTTSKFRTGSQRTVLLVQPERVASRRKAVATTFMCPLPAHWAHRTLIFRVLKGLGNHIEVSVVSPILGDKSWTFEQDAEGTTGDKLMGHKDLHDRLKRER